MMNKCKLGIRILWSENQRHLGTLASQLPTRLEDVIRDHIETIPFALGSLRVDGNGRGRDR